jgi:hypothetical protein
MYDDYRIHYFKCHKIVCFPNNMYQYNVILSDFKKAFMHKCIKKIPLIIENLISTYIYMEDISLKLIVLKYCALFFWMI